MIFTLNESYCASNSDGNCSGNNDGNRNGNGNVNSDDNVKYNCACVCSHTFFCLHNAACQIYIMIMNIEPCDEPPTQEGWGIRTMQVDHSML